jgi:hypothetical protein
MSAIVKCVQSLNKDLVLDWNNSFKKILLLCVASFVGIVVLAIGINFFYVEHKMAKEYSSVNSDAVIVESRETVIDASPETVLATLTDINEWSQWNKSVSDASIEGEFTRGTNFRWNTESGAINSQIKVVQKDKVVWVGKTFGIFAVHSWSLTEVEGKTRVVSKESWEGLTAFVLQSSLKSQLGESLETMLADLKTGAENNQ